MPTQTDAELMRDIRMKHSDALELLYDRYARLVYSFAMRATGSEPLSRDVVQLVFTRLWTTRAEYDAAKGAYVSWLLTITRNIAIDVLRKERRHSSQLPIERLEERPDAAADNPEADVIRRSEFSEVAAAALRLTTPQRRVIDLLYWKGYTLQQIADMGGEPVGTVKNRLHQALKTLRRHLQNFREER